MTPTTEIDQLRQQNALLLKRLLLVSRERDQLLRQIAASIQDAGIQQVVR